MLDGEVEQLARGRVDPMRVLENHQYRLLASQTVELPDQRLQCSLLFALRTEVGQQVALRSRQRQQVGEKRHVLVRWCRAGQQGFELPQPCCGQIVAHEPRSSAELVDERKQRAVLVVRRAEVAQAEMRLDVEALHQFGSEA